MIEITYLFFTLVAYFFTSSYLAKEIRARQSDSLALKLGQNPTIPQWMKVPRKYCSKFPQSHKASHPAGDLPLVIPFFLLGLLVLMDPAYALSNSYDAMNASASSLVVGITSMRLLMITNEFSHRMALTIHRRKYGVVFTNR